jgi:hypothetical protein
LAQVDGDEVPSEDGELHRVQGGKKGSLADEKFLEISRWLETDGRVMMNGTKWRKAHTDHSRRSVGKEREGPLPVSAGVTSREGLDSGETK